MELVEQLTGQMLLCGLLGELIYQRPEKTRLASLYAEGVFTETPLGEGRETVQKGLELLQTWGREHWDENPDQALADLETDYMHLFVGLGKVLAPPWESVYFSDELQLFQEQTLQVRAWYRKYGLQIEHLHNEPDDHVGIELGFVAQLANYGLQALARNDIESANRLLADQAAFMSQHLQLWVPVWCQRVDEHAKTDFYRGLAWLVHGTVQEVASLTQTAVSV